VGVYLTLWSEIGGEEDKPLVRRMVMPQLPGFKKPVLKVIFLNFIILACQPKKVLPLETGGRGF